jgi:hypothetical protein
MTDGCATVDASPQNLRQSHRNTLRLTGSAAQSVHQRVSGLRETPGRLIQTLFQANRLSVNTGNREIRRFTVMQKPGPSQHTGIPDFRYSIALYPNADIVAVTTTERANHMMELHKTVSRFPLKISRVILLMYIISL